MSGAALSTLHLVLRREEVPLSLLRERLALSSAEASVQFSGRSERAGALRDEVHLLRQGDVPGPAGEVYQCWRRAVERPVSIKALHRALPAQGPRQLAVWLDAGQGSPLHRAALVIEAVLADAPGAREVALILAEAALAQALGWEQLVPLLAPNLTARDLGKTGDALRQACHRSLTVSAAAAVQLAHDLARRAAQLEAVVPKLRAKQAEEAVQMFLRRDAVMPAALLLRDRAARRLCDRLVELGVIRELTGCDLFRLYGV